MTPDETRLALESLRENERLVALGRWAEEYGVPTLLFYADPGVWKQIETAPPETEIWWALDCDDKPTYPALDALEHFDEVLGDIETVEMVASLKAKYGEIRP